MKLKTLIFNTLTLLFVLAIILSLKNTLTTDVVEVDISLADISDEFTIALVSDLHLKNSSRAIEDWQSLIRTINSSTADYVLLAGDYTAALSDDSLIDEIQDRFVNSLHSIDKPYALVLGNYETWTGRKAWADKLASNGLPILENTSIVLHGRQPICVAGVGDYYTAFDEDFEIPVNCSIYPTVYLTHDPAAAFKSTAQGVWLAGHTHCGQIRLPLWGPLWVPSSAPEAAYCGLYQDEFRTVFVSSGVGNSLLPIRFLAQSRIEIISFNKMPED